MSDDLSVSDGFVHVVVHHSVHADDSRALAGKVADKAVGPFTVPPCRIQQSLASTKTPRRRALPAQAGRLLACEQRAPDARRARRRLTAERPVRGTGRASS